MRFERLTLETDEHILMQVRKHWFVLALQIFLVVIVAILPFALYFAFMKIVATVSSPITLNTNLVILVNCAWLLVTWMALFSIWTNYYLDVWTITNKRLIAVDQRGFFFRTTASFRLERLQDIIVSVNGIVATLLDYGSLEIQTAGAEKNFKEFGLPSPGDLKGLILNATDALMRSGNQLNPDHKSDV